MITLYSSFSWFLILSLSHHVLAPTVCLILFAAGAQEKALALSLSLLNNQLLKVFDKRIQSRRKIDLYISGVISGKKIRLSGMQDAGQT